MLSRFLIRVIRVIRGKKMKIIFFGSGAFGVPSLEALIKAKENLVAVITAPDKPKGRGLKLKETPIKEKATFYNLRVLQPKDTNAPYFRETLSSLNPDLGILIAFGSILNKEIINLPKMGIINLHPSLLPKYRGSAPIPRAIIAGEKETGNTIIKINEGVDSGTILVQEKVKINPEDTAGSLSARMAKEGASLLLKAIFLLKEGEAKLKTQDEKEASPAPKLKKSDGLIDWKKDAGEIHNLVRGLNPWPSAYIFLEGKRLKIWETEIEEKQGKPGEIISADENGILIGCKKGSLLIKSLQLEGKKKMAAGEFLRGHPLKTFPQTIV